MLTTLKNAFKIKEVRQKLLYTLGMLVVIRIGSQLPVPGVNTTYFAQWFAAQTNGAFSFFDAITGGSFESMAILALGINPYITSSIIMQLLTIAIPKLEEMQRDGEDGRKKIASITRYVTVVLALLESSAMAWTFGASGYYEVDAPITYIMVVATLTAGSAVIMWIGERITEKGIGNGISIVLVINIISRIPADFAALYEQFIKGSKTIAMGVLSAVIILAVVLAMVVITVILNGGVRKIPVQYAKKRQGRRMVGGQASNIPLKVNTAGVMPIIFASSILQFPIVLNGFFHWWDEGALVLRMLNQNNWCNPAMPECMVGLVVYVILVIFFAYFYTAITFNPMEIANNMKKQSGLIPGIRPGKPTSDYLKSVLNSVIFIGAVGLIIIAVVPRSG